MVTILMALTRLLFPAFPDYVKLTFVLAAHFTPVVCVNSQRLQIHDKGTALLLAPGQ